jgi:D-alanyl-D-alanine carboxypeptidase
VPQSTPVQKRAAFVFLPPAVALTVGIFLMIQPSSAVSSFDVLKERKQQRVEMGWVIPNPRINDYLYPALATNFAESQWVIVNKSRPLSPAKFTPELREIQSSASLDNSRNLTLRPVAAAALEQMAKQMSSEGIGRIFINSAYRSYQYQADLFVSKTKQYGLAGALLRSAKAGYSEHQTGLAVDVSVPAQGCAIMECFGDTKAGRWLAENSWQHGFIIRYEKGTTAITGYSYEPWHLRFIGKELARHYKEGNYKTLEELWQIPAAPDYPAIAESTSD